MSNEQIKSRGASTLLVELKAPCGLRLLAGGETCPAAQVCTKADAPSGETCAATGSLPAVMHCITSIQLCEPVSMTKARALFWPNLPFPSCIWCCSQTNSILKSFACVCALCVESPKVHLCCACLPAHPTTQHMTDPRRLSIQGSAGAYSTGDPSQATQVPSGVHHQ